MPDDIKAEVSVIKEEISAAKSEASSALTMLANLMGTIPADGVEDEPLAIDEKITEAVNTAFANMGLGALVAGEGAASNAITAGLLGPLGALLPFLGSGGGLEGEESEDLGAGGLLGLLMGGMFTGSEGEKGENPFQAIMAQMITNMLTVAEGEESPLKPLYDALDIYVKGEGDNAGKGGLFGELIAFVRGDKESGSGGLFGELTAFVNGSEGKDNGLKGELRKVVYAKDGLIAQMNKRGNEILDAIQALWNRLFGIRDDFNPEQGDDPRV
jgi:hypothetical protein